MVINDTQLLQENNYTKQLPQYIKDYTNFYKCIKMFSNYLLLCSNNMATIKNYLNVTASTGDVLNKIAQRVCVELDYKNAPDYEQNLKVAILGACVKKQSNANRINLQENILGLFKDKLTSIKIIDSACVSGGGTPMTVKLEITGNITSLNADIIEQLIIPDITGVLWIITYLLFGDTYFAFDRDINYIKGVNNYGEKGWDIGRWAKGVIR